MNFSKDIITAGLIHTVRLTAYGSVLAAMCCFGDGNPGERPARKDNMSNTKQGPNWKLVTENAEWPARDSQAEFVYKNHLWIMGGWVGANVPNPRDVWKSPDGKKWTCVVEEAPWEYSDLPAYMIFRDKMWIMGGRKLPGAENSNKVWSSVDGLEWTLESNDPGWCPRVSPAFAVFKDRMWVMGGSENFYDDANKTLNDIWSTANGRDWRLETENAAWSKRTHARAVVFKNKLWLMGGGKRSADPVLSLNDIWCSEDGINWKQVTSAAPWPPRMWFSLLVYRDRMWVLGGWSKETSNFNDVWFSEDGENWTELKSDVIWQPRHEHSGIVFQDKIWVYGGCAPHLSAEVWSLEIPENWF